ncbi:MAG: FAD-binding oxidoreductase [Acidobacteriota bacterium]|nr:MAG: FAD-binding oxidoreductase [Acidobacteriota bacterium]
MTYDVAIIGAGIVGAACADRLSAEGLSVCILDSRAEHAPATAAGMGHIVVMDDSEAQFALTSYSQQLWNELAVELPPEAEFENCGTLWIASDEEEMEEVDRKFWKYAEIGLASEILDERSLRSAEPNLKKGLSGALRVPGDSVVYQPVATNFLVNRAEAYGASVQRNASVSMVIDGLVETWTGERIEAEHIVVAAGCGSTLLPELARAVRPRKGHLVITERTSTAVNHQLVELGYLKSAHGTDEDSVAFNIQPRKTGQLLIGSSRQYGSNDPSVDFEIVGKMMKRALEYFPSAAGVNATRIWTGFRPATPDGLPYIGKVREYDHVFAATGHEGLGITTSLGTAALIADEILGRVSAIPREPYSPKRIDV